jgi:hypothetical protein
MAELTLIVLLMSFGCSAALGLRECPVFLFINKAPRELSRNLQGAGFLLPVFFRPGI